MIKNYTWLACTIKYKGKDFIIHKAASSDEVFGVLKELADWCYSNGLKDQKSNFNKALKECK